MDLSFTLTVQVPQLDALVDVLTIQGAQIMAEFQGLNEQITKNLEALAEEAAAIRALLEAGAANQQQVDQATARLQEMENSIRGLVP